MLIKYCLHILDCECSFQMMGLLHTHTGWGGGDALLKGTLVGLRICTGNSPSTRPFSILGPGTLRLPAQVLSNWAATVPLLLLGKRDYLHSKSSTLVSSVLTNKPINCLLFRRRRVWMKGVAWWLNWSNFPLNCVIMKKAFLSNWSVNGASQNPFHTSLSSVL